MDAENKPFCCEKCGIKFNFPNGILAEVKDNKVVVESCSPYTQLNEICMPCVTKFDIELA